MEEYLLILNNLIVISNMIMSYTAVIFYNFVSNDG